MSKRIETVSRVVTVGAASSLVADRIVGGRRLSIVMQSQSGDDVYVSFGKPADRALSHALFYGAVPLKFDNEKTCPQCAIYGVAAVSGDVSVIETVEFDA